MGLLLEYSIGCIDQSSGSPPRLKRQGRDPHLFMREQSKSPRLCFTRPASLIPKQSFEESNLLKKSEYYPHFTDEDIEGG